MEDIIHLLLAQKKFFSGSKVINYKERLRFSHVGFFSLTPELN